MVVEKIISYVSYHQAPILVLVYTWYTNTERNLSKKSKLIYIYKSI